MATMKFFNVTTPPTTSSPDGTYYVKRTDNPDMIDNYIVSQGVVKKLENSEEKVVQLGREVNQPKLRETPYRSVPFFDERSTATTEILNTIASSFLDVNVTNYDFDTLSKRICIFSINLTAKSMMLMFSDGTNCANITELKNIGRNIIQYKFVKRISTQPESIEGTITIDWDRLLNISQTNFLYSVQFSNNILLPNNMLFVEEYLRNIRNLDFLPKIFKLYDVENPSIFESATNIKTSQRIQLIRNLYIKGEDGDYMLENIQKNNSGVWSIKISKIISGSRIVVSGFETTIAPNHDIMFYKMLKMGNNGIEGYICVDWSAIPDGIVSTSANYLTTPVLSRSVTELNDNTLLFSIVVNDNTGSSPKARVVIPSKLFAIVDEEFNLYYDCIGLTSSISDAYFVPYLFDVICQVGICDMKSYRFTPTISNLNNGNPKEYSFVLKVFDNIGNLLEIHNSAIVVVPRKIYGNRNYSLVGDSNTAGVSHVPKYIQNLLDSFGGGNSITEVGICGYLNRVLAGINQFFAHSGISGAAIDVFAKSFDGNIYNFYKCAITGFSLGERKEQRVENIIGGGNFSTIMYDVDSSGNGYVWLRINSGTPVVGDMRIIGQSAIYFTVTSVSASTGDGILFKNGVIDWNEYKRRNWVNGILDIISIDLGINDMGQGSQSVFETSEKFDSFIADCKLIIDSFIIHNNKGIVILVLPKSPSSSRSSKCADGYRINLHTLRERIISEFDNFKYSQNVIISQAGLSIDRQLGYQLNTDQTYAYEGQFNKRAVSEYFSITVNGGDRFKFDPAIEGYHPHERGYKQIAYAQAGAVIYADYLISTRL